MKNSGKLFGPLIIISLSLGLAPFFPEPHLLGKIRWVLGGANGMQLIDWLDLLFHGFPWLVLILYSLHFFIIRWQKKNKPKSKAA